FFIELFALTVHEYLELRIGKTVLDKDSNCLILLKNSEPSAECIDFTMMCVFFFFVSVYSITSRNNAPISNFRGGFRCKSEYPWCIIEVKS
ncbi:Uncharacterized protein FWK35_00018390, partial [Aphis craccivora]